MTYRLPFVQPALADVQTAYESITLSAFLMLLMELVSLSTEEGGIRAVLAEKDKRKLPFPVSCHSRRSLMSVQLHPLSSEQALLYPYPQLLSDAIRGHPALDIGCGHHHGVLRCGESIPAPIRPLWRICH